MTVDVGMLALAGVGCIIWFVRLEAKVMYQEKDIQRLETAQAAHKDEIWKKMDDVKTTLTSILQALSKIEGKLEASDEHTR